MKLKTLDELSVARYTTIMKNLTDYSLLEFFYNVGLDLIELELKNDELFISEVIHEIVAENSNNGIDDINMRVKQVNDFYNECIGFYESFLILDETVSQEEIEKNKQIIHKMLSLNSDEENVRTLLDIATDAINTMADEYDFYDVLQLSKNYGEVFDYLEEFLGLGILTETFEMLVMHQHRLDEEVLDEEELYEVAMLLLINLSSLNKVRQVRLEAEEDASEKEVKIGRNDPCPCDSGKKYKKCCLNQKSATNIIKPKEIQTMKSSGKIYQLRIDLMDTKPPIWRRVLVDSASTLYEMHCTIQNAMGWHNGHLHGFEHNGTYYGPEEEDDEFAFAETKDECKHTIGELLVIEDDLLYYEYDFGDGWRHRVRLEKILDSNPSQQLPVCIKGKLACPLEDIGGVWGYYDMLEILADKKHPEHEETLEWIGGGFDPNYFDIDETNEAMREGCIELW